jgi:hypothetical protein
LYLPVTEFLADWEALQPPEFEALRIVGEERGPRTHELRAVFSRAGLTVGFYRAGSSEGRALIDATRLDGSALPVLVFRDGSGVADPSPARLATALGFATEPEPGASTS